MGDGWRVPIGGKNQAAYSSDTAPLYATSAAEAKPEFPSQSGQLLDFLATRIVYNLWGVR